MKSSTYVLSTEAYRNQYGRVTLVRVELASGHKLTVLPEDAPKAGDPWEIEARPA